MHDYHDSVLGSQHAGGVNGLFCDGHVEWARRSKWTQRSASARRRWNRDHEPHEETWKDPVPR
ncbi:MAG: hypothetical protein FJ404_12235 [Verrucomicrobia bacterium]|nr:hypothetical protein [Verrucomicrobiota bacterium]